MPSSPVSDDRRDGAATRRGRRPRRRTATAAERDRSAELARLEDRYKRALADLDNYRKRSAREIERRVEESREALLRDWLEAVDSVERALRMSPTGPVADGLRARARPDGGDPRAATACERIGAAGEPFDPERHEAVEVRATSEAPDQHDRRGRALGLRDRRPRAAARPGGRRARAQQPRRLMAVAFRDYYEALGVPRDASAEDIRRAYRKLAREYHPDVNKEPGAEDRFKEISEAYEVLRDPEKRARYDRLGANWQRGPGRVGAPGCEAASRGRRRGGGFGGLRRRAAVRRCPRRVRREARLQRLLRAVCSAAAARARRALGSVDGFERLRRWRGADQEADARALARGGRRAAAGGAISLERRPRLRGRHPARRARRSAHPARRRGRRGRRRRADGRPVPARAAAPAPALPRRRPRPLRRPADRAVGGARSAPTVAGADARPAPRA